MERKWFFSHGIMQASIITTCFHPRLSIAQELMLGGVVAKWDALFSTESLWDTQVGHQRAGRTRKTKVWGLSSHSTLQMQGYQTRALNGLEAEGFGVWTREQMGGKQHYGKLIRLNSQSKSKTFRKISLKKNTTNNTNTVSLSMKHSWNKT